MQTDHVSKFGISVNEQRCVADVRFAQHEKSQRAVANSPKLRRMRLSRDVCAPQPPKPLCLEGLGLGVRDVEQSNAAN